MQSQSGSTALTPNGITSTVHPASAHAAPTLCAATRVVKRLAPAQSGALKLTQRYGEALVCVRYRHDERRELRYTTVELVVDAAPIARRASPDEVVLVHIDFANPALQQLARAHGARWDDRRGVWCMTRRIARTLRLVGRIVSSQRPEWLDNLSEEYFVFHFPPGSPLCRRGRPST